MGDKRTQKTIKLIQDSFYILAKEKDVTKITIRDICTAANISRSTFYDYYEDYPSLLKGLENQMFDDLLQIHSSYKYDTDTYSIINRLFEYITDNRGRLFLLYDNSSGNNILEQLEDKLRQISIPRWLDESSITEAQANLVYTYMIAGFNSIISYYYKHPELDKEMVMDLVENLVKYGVYNYIYTK